MSKCHLCEGTGQIDESPSVLKGHGWIKVDCPECTKPRTEAELSTLAADFRAEIEAMKAAIGTPAWR